MEAERAQAPARETGNGRFAEGVDGLEATERAWQDRIEAFIRERPALTLIGGFVLGVMLGMWTRR